MTVPTRHSRLIPSGILTILMSLLAAGCETKKEWYRTKPEVAVTSQSAAPAGFLETDFEALTSWLDERFEVEYRNMTPTLMFEQPPINTIHYDTVNLPPDSELFELKSPNISRREILYHIAEHWDLTMTIVEEGGRPKIVRVEGKGDQITTEANIPVDPTASTAEPDTIGR